MCSSDLIWGHGTVERGPHIVEYMPIGSHHTWNGLLFVKGMVGYAGLAVPMAAPRRTAGHAMASEFQAPTMSSDATSRPK